MGVRRKKRTKAIVPLTSMGDIAFLLIIFFILASIPKGDVKLTQPEAEDLGELAKSKVTVIMDEEGQCYFQRDPVATEALTGLLKNHFETSDKNRNVIVEIDRNLPYEVFKDVYSAVSEAGGIVVARGEMKNDSAR
jgi:biopolymer transport protein ExbD